MMTRGLIMQKACRSSVKPRHLVDTRFQVCFTPLTGVLFTFPSRYWFTIGLMGVFSLTGWSRQIHTGFHVSRATQDTTTPYQYHGKGLSPAMAELSRTFPDTSTYDNVVLQPRNCRNNCGLGSSPVARHYLRNL